MALHKPAGYTCTRKDPAARHPIAELLPSEWDMLYSVGRLDRESEGLIFLTNDGDFALRLTHPRYGVRKTYRATVEEVIDEWRSLFGSVGVSYEVVLTDQSFGVPLRRAFAARQRLP